MTKEMRAEQEELLSEKRSKQEELRNLKRSLSQHQQKLDLITKVNATPLSANGDQLIMAEMRKINERITELNRRMARIDEMLVALRGYGYGNTVTSIQDGRR